MWSLSRVERKQGLLSFLNFVCRQFNYLKERLYYVRELTEIFFSACFCRDISETALASLPDSILGGLKRLIAESAFNLKELPPLQLFTKLRQANLTYPSHCCAFLNMHRNRYTCSASQKTPEDVFLEIV